MSRRSLFATGGLGLAAVGIYVGTTILGGILDPSYSHLRDDISELTGSAAPDRAVLASLYVAYNLVLLAFGYALFRAAGGGLRFAVAVVLLGIAALSGIGQVTVFQTDGVDAVVTSAGTMHAVLAGVSSLLCLVIAILYGFAFRLVPQLRRLSRYSYVTAVLLVMTAPLAVGSIGTDFMGLFERITIGVFEVWVVVVSVTCLVAGATVEAQPRRAGSAPAAI